ncbi:MAG: D-alanyl-D-alanine carboxypeptidase family protein, partial [Bacillota bacterium]
GGQPPAPSGTAVSVISATPAPAVAATPAPTVRTTPEPTPAPKLTFIDKVVCTANDSVNIRGGAGMDAPVIGTLPAGKTADVIKYYDEWAHISYNGIVGYVSRAYIMDKDASAASVPMGDWAAILVNPSHPLPKGYRVSVAGFEGGQVDARILAVCKQMFADAKKDGVTLRLVDAYRSYARQNELYQKKVNSFVAKGYSRADAETKAATITARPNTSEHQTGLALDIVTPSYTSRDSGFAKTKAFAWLNAHAQDYGFTLRYKADKVSVTKVIYEPWHWRFVGVKAAKAMKQSGQCYEEYLGKAG